MKQKFNKGVFITFEGPDGSGKTTITKALEKKLKKEGFEVILTREPGGKNLKFAEDLRKLIFKYKNLDVMTELMLFEAARSEHLRKTIIPALKKGQIVLCDRFFDSSVVYQGFLGGIDVENIKKVNEIVVKKENFPDKTFVFEVSLKTILNRLENRLENNRYDKKNIGYFKKLRGFYLEIAKDDNRFEIVNNDEEITETINLLFEKIKCIYEQKNKTN